jgi:hypothetical protein
MIIQGSSEAELTMIIRYLLVISSFAILVTACGGGGVNTEPLGVFNPNPLNNTNTPTASGALIKVLELSEGKEWAGSPKLLFDTAGSLQFVAPVPVKTPAGSAEFMFAKKLAGQNWTTAIQLFVAASPETNADLAFAVNPAGSAIVGSGFGATATLKFVSASGVGGAMVNRLISKPMGKFSDLNLLADGSAVYSTTEAKSETDATLVSKINQINAAGAVTLVGIGSEPARDLGSHFFSRTTAEGSLLHFTDPNPLAATNAVLASRAVSTPGFALQTLNKNNALEAHSAFSTSACSDSQIALTRSSSSISSFAGLMRVLETTGTPATARCALKFFKNSTAATTLITSVPVTAPESVFMSPAIGLQPFIHTDASDRSTIVWTKGTGGAAGPGTDASIDFLTITALNAISAVATIATSSTTFGKIVPTSVTYNQNSTGTGALAFLVSEPSAAPGVYVAYFAKYQPGGGFSAPTRLTAAANSLIFGLATAVSSTGVAAVVATGATCPNLTATTTGATCTGTSVRSIYSYQF